MTGKDVKFKIVFISLLLAGVGVFHLEALHIERSSHVFYENLLYFLPLILAAFWFGPRGVLVASSGILLFAVLDWRVFSLFDSNSLLQVMADIVVAAILGFLSDRDRKAQERLREVESLAAMGRVMSEVAHDIKTPLLAMSGLTRIVERTLGKDNPSREKLTLVIRETERLERLMQDMMAFSRPMKLDRTTGHIDQVVKECLELVESKARERSITLHGQSAKNLQPVSFDGLRMKQLLINLLTNAVEASPEGETVTVQSYQKRKTMFLDIIDHGCGVPQDKREKIFSPFFTTKQEGTGLGLSIAKKIVEAHHGHLEILDNPEKGVTFRVAIPTM